MNVLPLPHQSYWNAVSTATRRNSLTQVAQAKQTGTPLDTEFVQQSNQELRNRARETGAELYAQQLKKQALETYLRSTDGQSEEESNPNRHSSENTVGFDAVNVNQLLQSTQQKQVAVALYQNMKDKNFPNNLVHVTT